MRQPVRRSFRWILFAVVFHVVFAGRAAGAQPDPSDPIWWSQYTVGGDVLKLQVQLDADLDSNGWP